ncbi:hypothetical protein AUR64_19125 [Haloprofundus marisrubri]|uniref:Uncharacterized protein n=1 Tax=Haloprofundus marisrubri TaxID=1514971 RepID=A0A0W1R4X3_9EURY|nr:hypothetical protein [Haloprofundus marisrubri]KTG08346.1 hypothetical protein AUR64_19125 [Haloprofundus marisrubri]
MPSQQKPHNRIRDVAEAVVLLVLPIPVVAPVLLTLGRNVQTALFLPGLFGFVLFRVRLRYRAIRTDDGIERRLFDPEETWWAEAASIEYDEKYDRILAPVCAAVALGAFALVPVYAGDDGVALRLVMVGAAASTGALAVYGVAYS